MDETVSNFTILHRSKKQMSFLDAMKKLANATGDAKSATRAKVTIEMGYQAYFTGMNDHPTGGFFSFPLSETGFDEAKQQKAFADCNALRKVHDKELLKQRDYDVRMVVHAETVHKGNALKPYKRDMAHRYTHWTSAASEVFIFNLIKGAEAVGKKVELPMEVYVKIGIVDDPYEGAVEQRENPQTGEMETRQKLVWYPAEIYKNEAAFLAAVNEDEAPSDTSFGAPNKLDGMAIPSLFENSPEQWEQRIPGILTSLGTNPDAGLISLVAARNATPDNLQPIIDVIANRSRFE